MLEGFRKASLTGRLGNMSDIVDACVFLLENSSANGMDLPMHGGHGHHYRTAHGCRLTSIRAHPRQAFVTQGCVGSGRSCSRWSGLTAIVVMALVGQ
jgi:hypothetical protein